MKLGIINTNIAPKYLQKYVIDVFKQREVDVEIISTGITDKTSAADILAEYALWDSLDYLFVCNH